MRNQDSLFNHYCDFINYVGEGNTYTSKQLINGVGIHETPTRWKQWSNNKYYTTRGYQSLLRQGGFVRMIKRGEWEILREVPEWFTLPHLYTLVGHTYSYQHRIDENGRSNWDKVPRTEMTATEIQDKLNGITPDLRKAAETMKASSTHVADFEQKAQEIFENEVKPQIEKAQEADRLQRLEAAMRVAFNSTYGAMGANANSSQEDPMYYASGAYAKEAVECVPASAEKIQPEDSAFYQKPEQWKYGQQLQENLMMNTGYIHSALVTLDQADFIDPVMHARVLNIMSQLQDLQRTIDERVEYKRNKQTI